MIIIVIIINITTTITIVIIITAVTITVTITFMLPTFMISPMPTYACSWDTRQHRARRVG